VGAAGQRLGGSYALSVAVSLKKRARCLPIVYSVCKPLGWNARDVLRGAFREGDPDDTGDVRCVEWVLDTLYAGGPCGGSEPLTEDVFATVAGAGSVQLLQTLRDRGCPMAARAWVGMAVAGCVAGLRWLALERSPRPVRALQWGSTRCRDPMPACQL
jgi:hypothetical protein